MNESVTGNLNKNLLIPHSQILIKRLGQIFLRNRCIFKIFLYYLDQSYLRQCTLSDKKKSRLPRDGKEPIKPDYGQ